MKHCGVLDRPRLDFFAAGTIYQYGQPFINRDRQIGVPTCAENGRSAGIGVDGGEVLRRQRETALRVVNLGNIMKVERRFGWLRDW